MLTPSHFGLPPQFAEWRDNQLDAIERILNTDKRFIAICAPTGFGKSLVYMGAGKMMDKRTCVLTSTKGLQDQLVYDFGDISSDIRGQSNYRCPIAGQLGVPIYTVVADAPCAGGFKCEHKHGKPGCEYYDRYRAAQRAPIVTTNYACWLYDSVRQDKLDAQKAFDILVLDEAHDAPEQLAGYLQVEIDRKDCLTLGITWPNPKEMTFDKWRSWGKHWMGVAKEQIETEQKNEKVILWRKVERKLRRIWGMTEENSWVVDPQLGQKKDPTNPLSVRFDPLWVQPYAEPCLFRGARKVVLVSATVRPKTLQLLGIPSGGETDFVEYPSAFPKTSRPIIHVPTVQMNYRNENDDFKLQQWLNRIDQIIDGREDRKGIIHTVSFKRAQLIYSNSRHSSKMLIHTSSDTKATVAKFKSTKTPCVLLSPSVSTGYDFPYSMCEYQIVVKLPFPSSQDLVIKARTSQDKDYLNYIVMQILVQETGRGMRAKDDRCETLVIDDNIEWFMGQNGLKFAPKWFREGFVWGSKIPEPLEKIK